MKRLYALNGSDGYSQLISALKNELEISKRPESLTTEERQNLLSCFECIQPTSITDLAFVVWCGCKYKPALEYATQYYTNKTAGKSYRDYYPFIALDGQNLPDSAGVYAFKEELAGLVAELTGSRNDYAMAMIFQIYRADHPVITRKKIGPKKLHMLLKPEYQQRFTTEDVRQLHGFIADRYSISCSYSLCVVLVERALKKLETGHNSCNDNQHQN